MAVKFFYGFDTSNAMTTTASPTAPLIGTTVASTIWNDLAKPAAMYHNKGLATLDKTISHPNSPGSSSRGSLCAVGPSGTQGLCFGPSSSSSLISGNYGAATSTTRATWATAQGHQICFVRALMEPALSANEYWFSFDLYTPHVINANLDSTYEATTSWKQVFRWGDISINCKSMTFATTIHTLTFSIRNNGTEVATLTVGDLDCDVTPQATFPTSMIYCRLHVKLDSSTGLIDFYANGAKQSVAYTNQNTVSSISNAAATEFYFGPPVLDNGTDAWVGGLDNIIIDDAAFPTGRPFIRYCATYTTSASSQVQATSGTVHGSLEDSTDSSQLRFLALGGYATIGKASLTTTGFSTDFLGMSVTGIRCANRFPGGNRFLKCRLDLSGVESSDAHLISSSTLPFSTTGSPPETAGVPQIFNVFTKANGTKYALSDYNSLLIKLIATN